MTEYNGVERSKTEQLRKLLDDRGVKWDEMPGYEDGRSEITATRWRDGEGGFVTMCITEPQGAVYDFFWLPTPEQAVEATLGRGTCKVVGHGYTACDDIEFHWYALSCDHELRTLWAADTVGMYCPYCGRKVES